MDRVVIIGFDGMQSLDCFGPSEVFATANRFLGARYRIAFTSAGGGPRSTTSGAQVLTEDLERLEARRRDTAIVVGGEERAVAAASRDTCLRRWLVRAAPRVRRLGSVCSGTFVLAAAGLLDGRRAATHWDACDRLRRFRPRVQVDPNSIFVTDGRIWTSAGVTTGIDMALAMIEEDLGTRAADTIAARLVLYARRPGFQSQFSETLVAQSQRSEPLGAALTWARQHLETATPTDLAAAAGQSPRTFHRRCMEQMGTTPAKLIEKLRVEQARTLLATTSLAAKTVAAECGFGSTERMNRAFERALGMAPRHYRVLFQGNVPPG